MSQRITFYTTLVQREKLDEWLEKQKSTGSFVLAIPIVPLVNISSMPYLESEQQDETRNATEYDSEKAAVTDAQETTANEQTKPRTERLRLDSKIKGKNIKLLNKSLLVYPGIISLDNNEHY
jgi:cell fate regulator YaaT (PSP1 superfamily)